MSPIVFLASLGAVASHGCHFGAGTYRSRGGASRSRSGAGDRAVLNAHNALARVGELLKGPHSEVKVVHVAAAPEEEIRGTLLDGVHATWL